VKKWRNIILVLLGGCSFGILSTFVKLSYEKGLSLADVTSAQAYFGAAILCLFLLIYKGTALFNGGGRIRRVSAAGIEQLKIKNKVSTTLRLILTGMASGAISICYYKCVEHMAASIAIILLMQYTWMSILLERFIFKIPVTGRKWLFVGIVLLGTILGSGLIGQRGSVDIAWSSIAYGLLAGFFYAVFILANGHIGNEMPAVIKSSWVVLGVVLLIMAVFPPFGKLVSLMHHQALPNYLKQVAVSGLLLGFFGMVLPPLLFASAIPKIGVALSSILGSIELPTAALCGYFVLQENISLWQLAGILFILGAIIIVNIEPKPNGQHRT
jgi:drug/metabolite transporter (DMT)-like permease